MLKKFRGSKSSKAFRRQTQNTWECQAKKQTKENPNQTSQTPRTKQEKRNPLEEFGPMWC